MRSPVSGVYMLGGDNGRPRFEFAVPAGEVGPLLTPGIFAETKVQVAQCAADGDVADAKRRRGQHARLRFERIRGAAQLCRDRLQQYVGALSGFTSTFFAQSRQQ